MARNRPVTLAKAPKLPACTRPKLFRPPRARLARAAAPAEPGSGEKVESAAPREPGSQGVFASGEPGPAEGPGNQSGLTRTRGARFRVYASNQSHPWELPWYRYGLAA